MTCNVSTINVHNFCMKFFCSLILVEEIFYDKVQCTCIVFFIIVHVSTCNTWTCITLQYDISYLHVQKCSYTTLQGNQSAYIVLRY